MFFKPPKKPISGASKFNLRFMRWINIIAVSLFLLGLLYKMLDWFVFD